MSSRGRFATPADFPRQDCSPYRGLHVRRESLGCVHRSRAILCRPAPNRSCCLTLSTDLQAELFERYIYPLMRGIAVGGVAFNIPQTFDEFFNCMRAIVRKLPKEQQSEDDTRTLDILWHTEVRHRLAHLLHLPGHTKGGDGGDGEIPERVRQEAWAWAASPTFSPTFQLAGAAQELAGGGRADGVRHPDGETGGSHGAGRTAIARECSTHGGATRAQRCRGEGRHCPRYAAQTPPTLTHISETNSNWYHGSRLLLNTDTAS